jgi:hypothetical protein
VWEPEHKQMTAAPKWNPHVGVTSWGCCARRTRKEWGEADALQEETGRHWRGATGYGSKHPRTDRGDNVGNHHLPAGACSNLRRPDRGATCKAGWRHLVGRMSQYEQRRLGNASRGDGQRLPEPGNACLGQRGSRSVAGDTRGLCLDFVPASTVLTCRRARGITRHPRGVRGQALELRGVREGLLGKAAAANRTREIRLSGMRGGLVET